MELTSSGWLFDPERLFWIAGQINKDRPQSAKIGLELYPVHYFNGLPMGPGRIDGRRIDIWKKEYGDSPIERIHLPFHWDLPTAFKNFFWTSLVPLAKPYEPGTPKDRFIAAGLAAMTTTVQNRFALNLAKKYDAGLNAHVHVVEESAKRGKVKMLTDDTRYVWVENELDYPRERRDQVMAERDPVRAIRAVEQHGLEGVILGVDHDFLYKFNPVETLDGNYDGLKKHLRSVHISGSEGHHGLVSEEDRDFWEVVEYVRGHNFDNNVRFCLDLNPFEMRHLTRDEQLDYISGLVEKLEAA